ncbi:CoA-binding protein [Alicyclobacillus dauci]|uniref:CoA-binding protein n=1 Tax=Alicyclobacillus dauci TaxID=1475485 RepID=A0ABY6Z2K2_9BACL|nr:CoA-binding protein [Alicyclobacillus dauci]WAH36215.1 CoA-binding protein [Alicyclobacillus dauci]
MDALLSPKSIALIGVSADIEKISGRLLPILQAYRFPGRIYPINPKRTEICGLTCYATLLDLPESPDVAVLLTPNTAVPNLLRQAVDKGVPYVLIYSSGFNEVGGDGERLAQEVQDLVCGTNTRALGPNSEGFYDLGSAVALSFSPVLDPLRGRVPLKQGGTVVLSQSGGLGFAIADQLESNGIGIRAIVTTGNELDLEIVDFLKYYAGEPDVDRIVLFFEGIRDLGAWRSALSKVQASGKTALAIHIGSSQVGVEAVRAHTGQTPSSDEVQELLHSLNIAQFADLDDLIDFTLRDSRSQGSCQSRVAIVSTSGGAGIWCADLAPEYGLRVPRLSIDLVRKLQPVLPGYASLLNPIDVTAQAIFDGSICSALSSILSLDDFDAVLFVATLGYDHKLINDPQFQELLQNSKKPISVFSYTPPSSEAKVLLESLNIPVSTSPRQALRQITRCLQEYSQTDNADGDVETVRKQP